MAVKSNSNYSIIRLGFCEWFSPYIQTITYDTPTAFQPVHFPIRAVPIGNIYSSHQGSRYEANNHDQCYKSSIPKIVRPTVPLDICVESNRELLKKKTTMTQRFNMQTKKRDWNFTWKVKKKETMKPKLRSWRCSFNGFGTPLTQRLLLNWRQHRYSLPMPKQLACLEQ